MNDYERKSMESYNEIANGYDHSPEGKFTESFKRLLLEKVILSDNQVVLDVACGNGKLLQMLSRKANIDGYGVDISKSMIDNARTNNPHMIFETSSCEAIPFENNFIDVITVSASYHHFPRIDLFAKEVNRLLKRNGSIYIAEIYYPWLVRKVANPFLKLSKAGDFKFYSPKEIVKAFLPFGFSEEFIFIEKNIQVVCLRKRYK